MIELPEHIKQSIWNPTLTIERQNQAWPLQHTATHFSMLSKYDNDLETSGVVRPLHRACSTVSRTLGRSLVILNGAQLRAIYPKASLHESCISIIDTNTANTGREGCYSLPQSTRDPITVIMVISVGRTLMPAPAGSSECHLIKAMILFLPQQQHKYPHSRPYSPSIILEWW